MIYQGFVLCSDNHCGRIIWNSHPNNGHYNGVSSLVNLKKSVQ